MNYSFENNGGHIDVYCNGEFLFSADNISEAEEEIRNVSER